MKQIFAQDVQLRGSYKLWMLLGEYEGWCAIMEKKWMLLCREYSLPFDFLGICSA